MSLDASGLSRSPQPILWPGGIPVTNGVGLPPSPPQQAPIDGFSAGVRPLERPLLGAPGKLDSGLGPLLFKEPQRWERLLARRQELGEVREGRHGELLQFGTRVDRDLERDIAANRSAVQRELDQIEKERKGVHARFSQAEKVFQGGWRDEEKHYSDLVARVARSQMALDEATTPQGEPSSTGELHRLSELEKMLADPRWASNKETLRRVRDEVSQRLAERGIHLPGAAEMEHPPKGVQGQVARYHREQKQQFEASNFPRTKKQQQAWLEDKRNDREQALAALQGRAELVRSQGQDREEAARARAAAAKVEHREERLREIGAEVQRLEVIESGELQPEVLKSAALSRAWGPGTRPGPVALRLQGQGLVGDFPQGRVSLCRKGDKIEVEFSSDNESVVSQIWRDQAGTWQDSSHSRQWASPEDRKAHRSPVFEEKLKHDGHGREVRDQTTRQGNRVTNSEVITQDGQELSTLTQVTNNGRFESLLERSITRTDGRVVAREKSQQGALVIEAVQTTEQDGTVVRSESRKEPGQVDLVNLTTRRPDGTSQEIGTFRDTQGVQHSLTVDRQNGVEVRREVEETCSLTPDPDVPGLGWVGSYNPQDLVERLGDEDNLRAQRTVRTVTERGETSKVEMVRLIGGQDGNRELLETRNPAGASVWEYREKQSNSEWNSQIFFQGSDDTIVTKRSQENGWHVERTQAQLGGMEAAKQGEIAATSDRSVRSRENAKLADVQAIMKDLQPPLLALEGCESFQRFSELAGTNSLKVVAASSNEKFADGHSGQASHVVVESANGYRLVLQGDPQNGTLAAQTESVRDANLATSRSVIGPTGERVEMTPDGETFKIGSDGKTFQLHGEDWHPVEVRHLKKAIGNAMKTLPLNLKTPGGLMRARVGFNLGKALTGLGALSMGADLVNGDYELAARKGSDLGIGTSSLIRRAETLAAARGTTAVEGAWLARAGRGLGVAGVVGGGAFAIYDLAQGEYTHAALGAAATGGSTLALFGSASWAGPVGWGAAALATAGTFAYDYNESTRIAEYRE